MIEQPVASPPQDQHCAHGGRLFEAIGPLFERPDDRPGCVPADVLDAWYPPAPAVVGAIAAHLPWLVSTSPPCRADALREALAAAFGLHPANMVVGAGSSDLIFRLMPRLFAGKRVGIASPAYGEYAHVLTTNAGADVVRVYADQRGFGFTAAGLLAAVKTRRLDGLCLVNPCNPTGQTLDPAEMDALLAGLPATCTLVVDETYIGYVGRSRSVASRVAQLPNLVVIESLSKVFALSGIRAGVAAMDADLARGLEREMPTYHIGSITTLAVARALAEEAYYADRLRETADLRAALAEGLAAFGDVLPSQINAVLLDLGPARGAEALRIALAEQGVYVRNIEDQGLTAAEEDRFLRVAVLDAARNARTLAAFRALR